MIEDEILKHIPEAVGVAKVAAASIPFNAIVKRMLGPAADELAEMWRDQVRLYRYERQLKCVEKAEKMAKDAGFSPQAVPPKILFPLLEGASFEDNEDLHTMWAALLANASSPENAEKVRPAFIAILKVMAPDEAAILKWLNSVSPKKGVAINWMDVESSYVELGFVDGSAETCLNGLEANRLIQGHDELKLGSDGPFGPEVLNDGIGSYTITDRGRSFIEACGPPKPKA